MAFSRNIHLTEIEKWATVFQWLLSLASIYTFGVLGDCGLFVEITFSQGAIGTDIDKNSSVDLELLSTSAYLMSHE